MPQASNPRRSLTARKSSEYRLTKERRTDSRELMHPALPQLPFLFSVGLDQVTLSSVLC